MTKTNGSKVSGGQIKVSKASKTSKVNKGNIVGKARIIFFSSDRSKGNFFQFWKWNEIIRFNRIFKKIK